MKAISKVLFIFLSTVVCQAAYAAGIVDKAFSIMSNFSWVPVVITIMICLAHFHEHGGNWSPKYVFKSIFFGCMLTVLLFAPNEAFQTVTDEGQRMINGRYYKN